MENVRFEARTDAEGRLILDVSTPFKDQDVEVTVKPKAANSWDGVPLDDKGWSIGFWQRFAGAFPDAPDDPEELPLNEPRL